MDIHRLRYDPDLLAAYGLQGIADKLPPVRGSSEICGRVSRTAAEATGPSVGPRFPNLKANLLQ